jgi:hypothetical protein
MLLVNESADIVRMLSINLCPPTANMDALVALGFSREFRAIASGERAPARPARRRPEPRCARRARCAVDAS